MTRAFLIILDSVGIGGAPDALAYGDTVADTVGHIAEAAVAGRADRPGLRSGPLRLPNLVRAGLGLAAELATGRIPPGLAPAGHPTAAYGAATERSRGKDTPSGHWEIAGVPVTFDWGYFPRTVPAIPPSITAPLIAQCGLPGVLGLGHASGTEIVALLGEEHVRTSKPILYTSADSVLQIAAHEQTFGLERLYAVCGAARKLVDSLNIGRVIARPFIGTTAANFQRTGNRKDYAIPPPSPTLLDIATAAGREVRSIGKIGDIFAHSGTGQEFKASGHPALLARTLESIAELADGGLAVTNFVDFDMLYGHRRDVPGYAAALEDFDVMLPNLTAALQPGDLLVLTADHGCDPTAPGTDHTRERVPVLCLGPGIQPGSLGARDSFADIGQSIATHLMLPELSSGTAFVD